MVTVVTKEKRPQVKTVLPEDEEGPKPTSGGDREGPQGVRKDEARVRRLKEKAGAPEARSRREVFARGV